MLKVNKCYCVFFTSLFTAFLTILVFIILEIIDEHKCFHPEILETDELQIGNKTFFKREFKKVNETHFGICLEKKIPVIRKCCDEDKILRIDEVKKDISCVSNENHFEAELKVYDDNNQPLPECNISNFYRQYGLSSCPNKKYFVDVTGENFTFHRDGTLIKSHNQNKIYNSDQFCLDLRDDDGFILTAFICVKRETDWESKWELRLFAENNSGPFHKSFRSYILNFTGMIISIPFLFAIFLFHAILKELRTHHGIYVMCHTASLLVFYIFLAIFQINGNDLKNHHPTFCKICGYITQFSFHSAFFWLHIMSADMWWSIKIKYIRTTTKKRYFNVKRDLKRFLFCCCYGWGGPGIILCISLLMDFHPDIPDTVSKPNIGRDMCLINTESNKFSALYLYGPMGIIIISNLYFFISTAANIFRAQKDSQALKDKDSCSNQEEKEQFVVYLQLFIIMGLNWFLELLRWMIKGSKYIWYIPNFSNSLQGLYIFMIMFPSIEKEVLKKLPQVKSLLHRVAGKEFANRPTW